MGSSSATKFKIAMDLEHEGRIRMSFIKNGASTGRYASWGFQMHNLAKLCAEDPDELFKKFKEIGEIDNPFKAAKSLVRALIKAPEGQSLCVADWSGIETHLLFWFVGDETTLDILRRKEKLYNHMAADVYNCKPDEVDKETQYPLGKALILGCGYGMGFKRFQQAAKSFGLNLSLPEANLAVTKYRLKFPKVVKVWYELTNAARLAIHRPKTRIPCHKVWFMFDGKSLWTELPSGRMLHYPEACIKEGDIQYYSTNAKTHQWEAQRLTPSQNIENIIQAIAADILERSIINIAADLPTHEHIGHVHDENITLVNDDVVEPLESLIEVMCRPIEWAKGLPLFAEGYMAKRFKK
jgi:DNA polymerase